MKTLTRTSWYRNDIFEIVDVFPAGYVLWNIGRDNFPFPCYIPLARPNGKYTIDLTTLKTIKVSDEKMALHLMNISHRYTIDKNKFYEIVEKKK